MNQHRLILPHPHRTQRGRRHWLWAFIIGLAVCGAAVLAVRVVMKQ